MFSAFTSFSFDKKLIHVIIRYLKTVSTLQNYFSHMVNYNSITSLIKLYLIRINV